MARGLGQLYYHVLRHGWRDYARVNAHPCTVALTSSSPESSGNIGWMFIVSTMDRR